MTPDEEIINIDKFLVQVKFLPTIDLYEECQKVFSLPGDSKDKYKIQDLYYILEVYNIVEKTKAADPYFMLSRFGRQVIKEGGWQVHLNNVELIELQKESDRQLATEVNKSVKKTSENQFRTNIATVFLASAACVVSIIQYCASDSDRSLLEKHIRQDSIIINMLYKDYSKSDTLRNTSLKNQHTNFKGR